MIWRFTVLPSSRWSSPVRVWLILLGLFDHEDGGSMIFWNIGDDFPDDTVLHPGTDSIVILLGILETPLCVWYKLTAWRNPLWSQSSVNTEVPVLGYRDDVLCCLLLHVYAIQEEDILGLLQQRRWRQQVPLKEQLTIYRLKWLCILQEFNLHMYTHTSQFKLYYASLVKSKLFFMKKRTQDSNLQECYGRHNVPKTWLNFSNATETL